MSLVSQLHQKDYLGEINACRDYVKNNVRYVRDVAGIETLQTPLKTLEFGQGDCDDKSTLLAAMLESIGHKCRFKAVGQSKDYYCHVYPETFYNGEWVALETTEPVALGWKPPGMVASMVDSADGTANNRVDGWIKDTFDKSVDKIKGDITRPWDIKGKLSRDSAIVAANPAIQKIVKIRGLSTVLSVVGWIYPPVGMAMTYINYGLQLASASVSLDNAAKAAEQKGLPALPNGMSVQDARQLSATYKANSEYSLQQAERIVDIDKTVDAVLYTAGIGLSVSAYYLLQRKV
jgi:hypothetical protein